MRRISPLLVVFALASACAPDGREVLVDVEAVQLAPIVYGDAPRNPTDRAVVALLTIETALDGSTAARPFCSGTLIAPRIVLTAAHCIPTDFVSNGLVFFGDELTSPLDAAGTVVRVRSAAMHPSYVTGTNAFDLALVELESSPPGIRPIPALPAALGITSTQDRGALVRTVGFGLTEDAFVGERVRRMSVKRQVQVPITNVCASAAACSGLPGHSFAYDHADAGPCNGDSGGPALITRGGREYVGGVNSSISAPPVPDTTYADCTRADSGVETLVSGFETFIASFLASRALPVDLCAAGLDECDGHVTCTKSPGWYACSPCGAGLMDPSGDGRLCLDIDECAGASAVCASGQACVNVEASYRCDELSSLLLEAGAEGTAEGFPGELTGSASCSGSAPGALAALLALLGLVRRRR